MELTELLGQTMVNTRPVDLNNTMGRHFSSKLLSLYFTSLSSISRDPLPLCWHCLNALIDMVIVQYCSSTSLVLRFCKTEKSLGMRLSSTSLLVFRFELIQQSLFSFTCTVSLIGFEVFYHKVFIVLTSYYGRRNWKPQAIGPATLILMTSFLVSSPVQLSQCIWLIFFSHAWRVALLYHFV